MSANTQDRELLELAAKAAGIVGKWERQPDHIQERWYFNVPYDNQGMLTGFEWNPLTDDGDCFRLAKACNITINFDEGFVEHWKTLRHHFGDSGKTANDAVLACAAELAAE